jgi:hypothetical protein
VGIRGCIGNSRRIREGRGVSIRHRRRQSEGGRVRNRWGVGVRDR